MNTTVKALGATVGAVALVGSSVALALPAIEQGVAGSQTVDAALASHEGAAPQAGTVRVAGVQGSFSFDQNTVTSSADIANVFNKAAATLCASLPKYGVAQAAQTIAVSTGGEYGFTAQMGELSGSKGAESSIIGCSCASNVPGGGAIANAEVEGVTLASLAAMAGAK